VLWVLTLCLLQPAFAAPNAAGAQQELQLLRGRIEALQKKLADAEESRTEAADALRDSERAISEANRDLAALDQSLRAAAQRSEALREETRHAAKVLQAYQSNFARLLHQQYMRHGGQAREPVRLLLSGENPNDIARSLHYFSYLSRARADAIRGVRDSLSKLSVLSEEAAAKAAEIASIGAEQFQQRQRLEAEHRKRADVVALLSRDIQRQRQEIGAMQRNETRLTTLIEQLARVITRTPVAPAPAAPRQRNERLPEPTSVTQVFSRLRGQLALPVRGELTGRFGSPRDDGGVTWKGLFLAAKSGESVLAVGAGRVVFADWLRGFGNLLIIDHGEGYMSLYGYNETLLKRVGEEISRGDAVATVGNSGGSGESGLYFELRHQSKPFDPLTWVKMK
jgi:septal ring factor EnvC (AmiA/AmiB activator)